MRRGIWLAQSVEHANLDPRVVSLRPTSSIEISSKKSHQILFSQEHKI